MTPKTKTLILISSLFLGLFVFSYSASASTVTKTLYAWVKDAAGNISTSKTDTVDITLPEGQANTYYPTFNNSNLISVNVPEYNSSNPEHFLITTTNNGWSQINNSSYTYFYVAPGNYNTPVTIWQKGTAQKPKYISLYNGNNTHPAILSDSEQASVKLRFFAGSGTSPCEYWILDRISSLNYSNVIDGASIELGPGSKNIILNRLYLKNFYQGVYIRGREDFIENTNITIQNSRFDGESLVGIDDDQSAIMIIGTLTEGSFTRVSNIHIINNEIINSNDGIHLLRYAGSITSYSDYQGLIINHNIIYVDSRMYTDCNGNMDPNGLCSLTENAIDIKAGSDDPSNPIIIKDNFVWGFRNTDKLIGGSGDPGGAIIGHSGAKNIIIQNNVTANSDKGIGCSDSSVFDYSCENFTVKNNIIANVTNNPNLITYTAPTNYSLSFGSTFTETGNTTFEKNVINGKSDMYFLNSNGSKTYLPVLGDKIAPWIDIYTPSMFDWTSNNLVIQNNAIISMDKTYRNAVIPGTVSLLNNYLYNTPEYLGEGDIIYSNSTDANMADLSFTVDNFTNNPRTIIIKNVVSTDSSPHGNGVGLENLSTSPQGSILGTSTYHFTLNLKQSSTGNEVKELQKILISNSYLSGTPDGIYGNLTKQAVIKYQKANNITPLGIVGPKTREVLNK